MLWMLLHRCNMFFLCGNAWGNFPEFQPGCVPSVLQIYNFILSTTRIISHLLDNNQLHTLCNMRQSSLADRCAGSGACRPSGRRLRDGKRPSPQHNNPPQSVCWDRRPKTLALTCRFLHSAVGPTANPDWRSGTAVWKQNNVTHCHINNSTWYHSVQYANTFKSADNSHLFHSSEVLNGWMLSCGSPYLRQAPTITSSMELTSCGLHAGESMWVASNCIWVVRFKSEYKVTRKVTFSASSTGNWLHSKQNDRSLAITNAKRTVV